MLPDLSQQGFLGNIQGEGSSVSGFVWFHADVPSYGNGDGCATEKRSRKRPRSEVRDRGRWTVQRLGFKGGGQCEIKTHSQQLQAEARPRALNMGK